MSYCRWSSDDFKCDLYCYESADGGWVTHVAGNRLVGDPPHEDWSLLTTGKEEDANEFWRQHEALGAFVDNAEREPIGLTYDGETFHDYSLEAFKDRLLMLRASGYRFPDYVLTAVDEETAG